MSKRHREARSKLEDYDVTFVLLAPVLPWLPKDLQAVSGSASVRANCGHICWVSPEGMDMYLGPNYSLCSDCDRASFEPLSVGPKPDGVRRFSMPGALEHIEADQGVAGADQMKAWMRDHEIEEL